AGRARRRGGHARGAGGPRGGPRRRDAESAPGPGPGGGAAADPRPRGERARHAPSARSRGGPDRDVPGAAGSLSGRHRSGRELMASRVLVADDARFMRQLIRDIIEPEGFEVVGEAADGRAVVEEFMRLQPDVVTMDIVMPK